MVLISLRFNKFLRLLKLTHFAISVKGKGSLRVSLEGISPGRRKDPTGSEAVIEVASHEEGEGEKVTRESLFSTEKQKERGEAVKKLTPLVFNKPISEACQYIEAGFALTGMSEGSPPQLTP